MEDQSAAMINSTENQSDTLVSMVSGTCNQSVAMMNSTENQSDTLVSMVSGTCNQSAMTTRTESQSETMTLMDDGDAVSQIDDEYATQYFGFVPQTFMNGMYNCLCEYTHDAADALTNSILNTFKDSVSEAEVKEQCNKQLQASVKRIDKIFDKAETYLTSNIFSVPRHVVLPGDRAQVDEPCPVEEMAHLDDQLKLTTDKIWAVKYANARLCQRASDMKVLQAECNTVLECVENMYSGVAAPSKQFYQSAENIKKVSDILKTVDKEGKT